MSQETINKIKEQINNNKIIIYMKGTPDYPMCGFSAKAVYILKSLNVNFFYVNILEDNDIRKELPLYSNWPTFPQIYFKGNLIGGADIMTELYENEELEKILKS